MKQVVFFYQCNSCGYTVENIWSPCERCGGKVVSDDDSPVVDMIICPPPPIECVEVTVVWNRVK